MKDCPLSFTADFAGLLDEYNVGEDICGDFFKSAHWSPDGSTILAPLDSNGVTFLEMHQNLLHSHSYYKNSHSNDSTSVGAVQGTAPSGAFKTHISHTFSSTIIEAKWYPFMNLADPASCCYLTTSRDNPIHIWQYEPGKSASESVQSVPPKSLCSYRAYNQYDELETCQSVTFNKSGAKIYAGSRNLIRVFDVSRPGRDCVELPLVRSKRDPFSAFQGLVSTIAFTKESCAMQVYACGTFSNNISVFQEGQEPHAALTLRDVPVGGGVTSLEWSPEGNYLWVGGRRSEDIICYDLRSTRGEVGRVTRRLETNQRMVFDLDPWGASLATGSQDGEILIYSTKTFEIIQKVRLKSPRKGEAGYADCTSAVRYHPFCSLLCVSSGERRFSTSNSSEDSDSSSDEGSSGERRRRENPRKKTRRADVGRGGLSGLHVLQLAADRLSIPS